MKQRKTILLAHALFGLTFHPFATATIILCLTSYLAHGQSFVDPSNKWYVTDCCYSLGETQCSTYEYYFGDTITIDSHEYRILMTNNTSPLFEDGKYYREAEGKVYMKLNETDDETLLYDFNLQSGQYISIGYQFPIELQVISVDSVTLNTGDKRKRIELALESHPSLTSYWIEGIGGTDGTMNTQYIFTFDCWTGLNCYGRDTVIEYLWGTCQISSSTDVDWMENHISLFPNPATDRLVVQSAPQRNIVSVEFFNLLGQSCLRVEDSDIHEVLLARLEAGFYRVKVGFPNGQSVVASMVKQ